MMCIESQRTHWLNKETVSDACKKFKLKIVENVTVLTG